MVLTAARFAIALQGLGLAQGLYRPRFEPFADEEEPHYYLPTDLLSPELEMSETEFKESVLRWTERRKNGRAHEEVEDEEDKDTESEASESAVQS